MNPGMPPGPYYTMPSDSSSMTGSTHVCICTCTYKRPQGLRNLLEGIASLTFECIAPPVITVVIADNEVSPANEQICQEFSRQTSTPLIYVPVAERGITHARNACLEHVPQTARFIAFLDDDEIPEPAWLEQLLLTQARTQGEVIFGPVLPSFSGEVPQWMKKGGFFATPRWHQDLRDGQELNSAATGNCLLLHALIQESGLRFDNRLALSGGEDKLFFRQVRERGYRIFWASRARAMETVPPQRARFTYLLRTEFRRGNLKLITKLQFPQYVGSGLKKTKLIMKTLTRSATNVLSGTLIMAGSLLLWNRHKDRFFSGAFRVSEGLGMFTSLLGYRYPHYR